MGQQLDKFKTLAAQAGIDIGPALEELKVEIVDAILPHLKTGLESAGQRVDAIKAETLAEVRKEIPTAQSIVDEMQKRAGGAPAGAVAENASGDGVKGAPPGGMFSLASLLNPQNLNAIASLINAWKGSTPNEALRSQLATYFQGLTMGVRLKATPDVVAQAAKITNEIFEKPG